MDAAESARLEPKSGAVEEAGQGPQEENGAADGLSDPSLATAEPSRPQGKLKKTAFKLFGGKRSICTLPSFFGGKNKGQGKAASKKGLSKSKTHDGLSDIGYEDSGPLKGLLNRGDGFPSPQLPCSQSALLATEANLRIGFVRPSASLSGSSEGFEKKPSGDKSLFLPRPKKGLKGFFNSIRRHRKNKATEPEKTELQEWRAIDSRAKVEEQKSAKTHQSLDKEDSKRASPRSEWKSDASPDANESKEKEQPTQSETISVGDAVSGGDADLDTDGVFCVSSTYGDLPDALEAEYPERSPPRVPSGEQLSLMFGDVTSLKSFDSFTGCGDIIAEPDIDSNAGSCASAERSRDAGKRGSCLVTYQGGGEEMALPDEIEEYLQQVWEGAVKAGEAYETHLEECELQGANGAKQDTRLYVEGVDLLTPHSDQQESAPNSDEGYYDSTTPGPEDEAGEGLEEVKKDRLPRDSYSGDALYEFYEPDDTLLSPSHGGEPWFDPKASPPDIVSHFFDFGLPDQKDLVQMMGQKKEVMETEEERMAAIQKHLLFWELQREPALKHLEVLHNAPFPREKQHGECNTKSGGLLGGSQSCLSCEDVTGGKAEESRDGKDLQEMLCLEKRYSPNRLVQFMGSDSALDAEVERVVLESRGLSGLAMEKPVAYPFFRDSPPSGAGTDQREALEPDGGCEVEQAVNFSQALVDFTSSGTLFSSLSESLGSSDSGSAFTQNLPALPTMVTFDIVDVEQDGEGECEQHLEMSTGEELAASFEAFDDRCFVPKESFAECDERMFSGSFQSCGWGIASLPRRLRLQELCPPVPEPLSSCRRSRSLDTDSLEFEVASVQLSKNGFKPCEIWSPWSGCRKRSPSPDSFPAGKAVDGGGALSWPGLQNVPGGEAFSSQGAKLWGRELNAQALRSVWGALEEPGLGQSSSRDGEMGFPPPRPMSRPSNLPLHSQRPGVGGNTARKLAWVLPLGEGPSSFDFNAAPSPEKPASYRPMDVNAQNVSAAPQR
ncbi:APC membrane recruitment protein 1 [Anolis carolinensis]|uniref:APC membrane recruitment protein 1 n=1 Tax=Anolis carolinensis TaxID=28377 RepID=UPI002F2B2F9A